MLVRTNNYNPSNIFFYSFRNSIFYYEITTGETKGDRFQIDFKGDYIRFKIQIDSLSVVLYAHSVRS